MKLENLAPYLPYRLKSYTLYDGNVLVRDITVNNVMAFVDGDINSRPILRPLSDLTKEIEHNGEKFVPVENLNPSLRSLKGFETLIKNQIIMYEDAIKLFKWHFDVFGLIEKGEAIDINTL